MTDRSRLAGASRAERLAALREWLIVAVLLAALVLPGIA